MFEIILSFFLGLSVGAFTAWRLLKSKHSKAARGKAPGTTGSTSAETPIEDPQTLGYETNLSWNTAQDVPGLKTVYPGARQLSGDAEPLGQEQLNAQRLAAELAGRETVFYPNEDAMHEAERAVQQNAAYTSPDLARFEVEERDNADAVAEALLQEQERNELSARLEAQLKTDWSDGQSIAKTQDAGHVPEDVTSGIEAQALELDRIEAIILEEARLAELALEEQRLAALDTREEENAAEQEDHTLTAPPETEASTAQTADILSAPDLELAHIPAHPPEEFHFEESRQTEEARLEQERTELAQAAQIEAQAQAAALELAQAEALKLEATTLAAEQAAREEQQRTELARAAQIEAQAQAAALELLELAQAEALKLEAATLAAEQAAREEQQRTELAAQLEQERVERENQQRQATLALQLQQENERAERQRLEQQALASENPEALQKTPAASASGVPPTVRTAKTPEQTVILVADDSKVVRIKISRALAKHNYQIRLAENGIDAAAQIAEAMPDILITDVEMPGLDGFGLTAALREHPDTMHLPIIMISGASDELADRAKQAGINVLLGKPYSDELLIEHIRQFMES